MGGLIILGIFVVAIIGISFAATRDARRKELRQEVQLLRRQTNIATKALSEINRGATDSVLISSIALDQITSLENQELNP